MTDVFAAFVRDERQRLEAVARAFVMDADQVRVEVLESDGVVTFVIHAADRPDRGRVIGRRGIRITELRQATAARAHRAGLRALVDVADSRVEVAPA